MCTRLQCSTPTSEHTLLHRYKTTLTRMYCTFMDYGRSKEEEEDTVGKNKNERNIKTTEHAISLEYPALNQAAAVTATTTTQNKYGDHVGKSN